MKSKILYIKLYEHMSNANEMAPFPIYDTGDMEDLKNIIDKMKYDDEKVECCSNCKSLYLVEDDGNTHCIKCRSTNPELEEFENIQEYLRNYGSIWDLNNNKDE